MARSIGVLASLFVAAIVTALIVGINAPLTALESEQDIEFGPWSRPVNLGPIVNSDTQDVGPALSKDGLSLYLHTQRHAPNVEFDLYVSRRQAIDLPWESPARLSAVVNSPSQDVTAFLTRGGRDLFFASLRTGNFELFLSKRQDKHDDFAWSAPVLLPPPVSSPFFDVDPAFFENPEGRPQLYFASDRATGGGQFALDLYVSEFRKNGTWQPPTPVAELNSPSQEGGPAIRFDGLEIIFQTAREGVQQELYVSRRNHLWERWSPPENIGPTINSPAADVMPTLSANGRTLYFTSNRPGGFGGFDLYASTRSRHVRRETDDRNE